MFTWVSSVYTLLIQIISILQHKHITWAPLLTISISRTNAAKTVLVHVQLTNAEATSNDQYNLLLTTKFSDAKHWAISHEFEPATHTIKCHFSSRSLQLELSSHPPFSSIYCLSLPSSLNPIILSWIIFYHIDGNNLLKYSQFLSTNPDFVGHSEPAPISAPSTGCPLLFSCGWNWTKLIFGFTFVTNSVGNSSHV
jgi:hypothetical protein